MSLGIELASSAAFACLHISRRGEHSVKLTQPAWRVRQGPGGPKALTRVALACFRLPSRVATWLLSHGRLLLSEQKLACLRAHVNGKQTREHGGRSASQCVSWRMQYAFAAFGTQHSCHTASCLAGFSKHAKRGVHDWLQGRVGGTTGDDGGGAHRGKRGTKVAR